MPDFERPMRSLELHLCKTDVERAYVRGRHAGLNRARLQILIVVVLVAAVYLALQAAGG